MSKYRAARTKTAMAVEPSQAKMEASENFMLNSSRHAVPN
jgi:hypothetical protein